MAYDDAAVLGLVRAYADHVPGVPHLDALDDPEAVLRWVAGLDTGEPVQLVPKPRPHVEAFTAAASREHDVGLEPELVAEMLPPDEELERWELVAVEGGRRYWFVDPSVAPRLRIVVLRFDYDHRYEDGEFVNAADLVMDALAKRRNVSSPPVEFPCDPGSPAPSPPVLEAPARALARALPLFGTAVPLDIAGDVAGVSTPQLRFAAMQLGAHGWAETATLYAWDERFSTGREIETLVVQALPGEPPDADTRARWETRAGDPLIELARRARRDAKWLDRASSR